MYNLNNQFHHRNLNYEYSLKIQLVNFTTRLKKVPSLILKISTTTTGNYTSISRGLAN